MSAAAAEQAGVGPAQGVLVDIGADRGALVVHADAADQGREIWLARRGEPVRSHVEILVRCIGAGRVFAGVFPSLREGEYEVWFDDTKPAALAAVVAGEVLEIRLN